MNNAPFSNQKTYVATVLTLVVVLVAFLIFLSFKIDKETAVKAKTQKVLDDSLAVISERQASIDLKARLIAEEKLKKEEAIEEKKFLKTRAGKIYKKHPEWSKEDCKNLAAGNIWIGMTIGMLKYRRGLPDSANPSNYGSGTSWQWCWHEYTPSCFYDNNDDGVIDSYN